MIFMVFAVSMASMISFFGIFDSNPNELPHLSRIFILASAPYFSFKVLRIILVQLILFYLLIFKQFSSLILSPMLTLLLAMLPNLVIRLDETYNSCIVYCLKLRVTL